MNMYGAFSKTRLSNLNSHNSECPTCNQIITINQVSPFTVTKSKNIIISRCGVDIPSLKITDLTCTITI